MPPAMAKVIINADDFGVSAEVNAGIVRSFENGWISSTTIMANMPAFEQACELTHEHKLVGAIGLHFNICEGRPLSRSILSERRFCDADGQFIFKHWSGMRLSKSERRAVAEELEAQQDACVSAGIVPTHLDTHAHIHTAWGIASVIIRLAPKLGLKAVRIHWNAVPARKLYKRCYYKIINLRYQRAGLAATAYAAQAQQGARAVAAGMFPLEITVHPKMSPDGTVMDTVAKMPVKQILDELKLRDKLISYGDLVNMADNPAP